MSYIDPSGCAVAPQTRPRRRRTPQEPLDRAQCYRELAISALR
jgi:hypothetical protein